MITPLIYLIGSVLYLGTAWLSTRWYYRSWRDSKIDSYHRRLQAVDSKYGNGTISVSYGDNYQTHSYSDPVEAWRCEDSGLQFVGAVITGLLWPVMGVGLGIFGVYHGIGWFFSTLRRQLDKDMDHG